MVDQAAGKEVRRMYVAPRMTTYHESEVARELGPVMLSGTGTSLQELSSGSGATRGGDTGPRR